MLSFKSKFHSSPHFSRVPTVSEIEELIKIIIEKLDISKFWINLDCALKTRGIEETKASSINMVKATKNIGKRF